MINRESNVIEYTYADRHATPDDVSEPLKPDYAINQLLSQFTGGIDPVAYGLAFADWLIHLLLSLGKQQALLDLSVTHACGQNPECEDAADDNRLAGAEWMPWPYALYRQNYLAMRQWWQLATRDVQGVEKHHTDMVNFAVRQWLEALSPANYLFTNPKVAKATLETSGNNLVKGMDNLLHDISRQYLGEAQKNDSLYQVGKNLAVTPGKVVFKNALLELIQYSPSTATVKAEPVLITPAWIMKYYILDLSEHNSLVKFLVDQGHTVFMISWKNPRQDDHNVGLVDYLKRGLGEAIAEVQKRTPEQRIHGVGYCLGGTLLSMAAAWLERENRSPFCSLTLLAAQTDFSDAGDLRLFIDESQLAMLEAVMAKNGYLPKESMAGTFVMLRANYLLWARWVQEYLMGERQHANDLLAWNQDATRMPARMHSEYLRQCYLNNALAGGQLMVDGKPIALSDIQVPLFVVGTAKDHVAPWQSVYKVNLLIDKDITFLLTNGGHNAGIISEPGHAHRVYQVATRKEDGQYLPPQAWLDEVPMHEGSWWPVWQQWLVDNSGADVPSRQVEAQPGLADAPGLYVLEP
ncbi:PHA/PHB synthase family protein [Alteromonas sp. AMM-1]|uniref:PHA/PHB synthase family protein n=1 Tax=Alteromonas sp. AMM-1 TaxID=3394233 RepID=UPI0039A4B722